MAHYVHDENHNRILAYSAEEVLSILAQAIEDGDLDNITADSAFITRLKSIADGKTYFVAFLTQAEYNALVQADELAENTLYYITDDSTISDLQTAFATFRDYAERQMEALSDDIYLRGRPISIEGLIGNQYVDITQAGLYCFVLYSSDPSAPSTEISEFINIVDLNHMWASEHLLYDRISHRVEIQRNSIYGSMDYCNLIVPYPPYTYH